MAAIEHAGGLVFYDFDAPGASPRNTLSGWKKWIGEWFGNDYVGHVDSVQLSACGKQADWQRAVDRLGDLDQARFINLTGTSVTDDVLAQLDGMNCLEELLLQYAQISDSGLAHVRNLRSLRTLWISGPGTGDERLRHLSGLTNLKRLMLPWRTGITDAGLAHLKGLTNLSLLNLTGTSVSDAGVKELQQALPSLTIVR